MFDDNNQPQSGIRTLFGPNGNVSAVVDSGSNTFAVIGDGPIKTVFGPHGKAHAIIENGSSGTVL